MSETKATPQDMLDKLNQVRKSGEGHSARCLALGHEDKRNSLGVKLREDGKIQVTCYRGCELEDILSPLGLKPADLYPNTTRHRESETGEYLSRRRYSSGGDSKKIDR